MKKLSIKGFTLIELLAVIVILGILMMTAVPRIMKIIANSKKDVFIDDAKAYADAAKKYYLAGDYDCNLETGSGTMVMIRFKNIDIDNTNGKDPFGKDIDLNNSAVYIDSTDGNGNYRYYVYMTDGQNSFAQPTAVGDLKRSSVVTSPTNTKYSQLGCYGFSDTSGCRNVIYECNKN